MSAQKRRRPRGLSEIETFTWFMPGDPPLDGCWDWPASTCKGYGQFSMNGGTRIVAAHRTSYRKFIGSIPDGMNILHSCDRRICVHPLHLSAGTQYENIHQAIERDCFAIGSRNGQAKLTEEKVLWIKDNSLNTRDIAKILNVSERTILRVRRGDLWKHVAGKNL